MLKATHQGELNIGNTILPCAVLENGTRIITQTSVFKAFGRPARGRRYTDEKRQDLPSFMDARNLQGFINHDVEIALVPITYITKSGREATGYKAEVIPLVCDVYLAARAASALTISQQPVANASELLVRSLSKVGIIALIDEATGYQEYREKDELGKILAAYIAKELLPWTQRFPHEFYQQMFRLLGWKWTEISRQKRPLLIGKYTKELIYDQLPPGVYEELRSQTPKNSKGHRKHQLHRLLTEDIGNRHLEKQIISVLTLMKLSSNWEQFLALFEQFNRHDELLSEEARSVA